MEYTKKCEYIEKIIYPTLISLGFSYKTASQEIDNWTFTRGNQTVELYGHYIDINLRIIVDRPVRRVIHDKELIPDEWKSPNIFGCFYETEDEFVESIKKFYTIITKVGLKKLDEICNPITDLNPVREAKYVEYLKNNRERAIKEYQFKDMRWRSPFSELCKLKSDIYNLSGLLFDKAIDRLLDLSAVYGDWTIRSFGGQWREKEDLIEIQNVGPNQCTVIPLDDVLKEWGMVKELNYLALCKKYGAEPKPLMPMN